MAIRPAPAPTTSLAISARTVRSQRTGACLIDVNIAMGNLVDIVGQQAN